MAGEGRLRRRCSVGGASCATGTAPPGGVMLDAVGLLAAA